MKMRALEMLNRKKDEFKDAGINNVRPQVSIGNPIEKILDLASAEKVDLIVIGSVGLSGISKLKALGSVSRSVSERAKCPVLIVRRCDWSLILILLKYSFIVFHCDCLSCKESRNRDIVLPYLTFYDVKCDKNPKESILMPYNKLQMNKSWLLN
jgi:hypothetical protein